MYFFQESMWHQILTDPLENWEKNISIIHKQLTELSGFQIHHQCAKIFRSVLSATLTFWKAFANIGNILSINPSISDGFILRLYAMFKIEEIWSLNARYVNMSLYLSMYFWTPIMGFWVEIALCFLLRLCTLPNVADFSTLIIKHWISSFMFSELQNISGSVINDSVHPQFLGTLKTSAVIVECSKVPDVEKTDCNSWIPYWHM